MSRRLTKAGFRLHILYQAAQLIPHFRELTVREVVEAVRLLLPGCRREFYGRVKDVFGQIVSPDPVGAIDTISQGVRVLQMANADDEDVGNLPRIAEQATVMERWSFEAFANNIVNIAGRNQAHVGGFLLMKYLGLPVIKCDIFYREVYSLEETYRILSDFNELLRDEVMSDLGSGTV